MADFSIKQNDTSPILKAQLQDDEGNPVDITDGSVRFHMKNANTGDLIVDRLASIDDATNGEVSYDWQEGDTQNVGRYDAEFQVEFSDGSIETFPNNGYMEIMVYKEIA